MCDTQDALGDGWRRVALVVGLAVAVVVAVLAGAVWLYSEHLYRTSYESSYTYELAVNTNESLSNVTLYLPVPAGAGTEKPDLGTALVEEADAADAHFSYRVADTERGPMLAVTADRITVTPRYYEYDSAVYAAYDANDTARVNVVTRVEGQNAWWVFGWNYDSYRDGIAVELRGPQDGWVNVTGTVEVDVEPREPPAGRAGSGESGNASA